jgi:hypothetical protein
MQPLQTADQEHATIRKRLKTALMTDDNDVAHNYTTTQVVLGTQ